jgi:hypothetical protein
MGIGVTEERQLDHDVALRGECQKLIQAGEELVIPLLEVESWLAIQRQAGPGPRPGSDVIRRLHLER